MKIFFKNKQILVSGGTGTIGSMLVKKILNFSPKMIRVFSNDENALYNLSKELGKYKSKLRYLLGDVRDKDRLNLAIQDIDIVYHAAALKHVPLCQYNPFEAVKTNVIGTQNIIEASLDGDVDRFIFIGTDKSVEPLSTMGATKLLGERLTIDANYYRGFKRTKFSCVRFGNVLNSRGSLIPFCLDKIKEKKNLAITDERMTRFIISMEEATNLILKATELMKGGEIFIFKNMKAVKIINLIEIIKELYYKKSGFKKDKINIKKIGKRPGEKLHELLMTEEEAACALETKQLFIILPYTSFKGEKPQRRDKNIKYKNKKYFSSEKVKKLTKTEIRQLLKKIFQKR